jgi:hypothetical protein
VSILLNFHFAKSTSARRRQVEGGGKRERERDLCARVPGHFFIIPFSSHSSSFQFGKFLSSFSHSFYTHTHTHKICSNVALINFKSETNSRTFTHRERGELKKNANSNGKNEREIKKREREVVVVVVRGGLGDNQRV